MVDQSDDNYPNGPREFSPPSSSPVHSNLTQQGAMSPITTERNLNLRGEEQDSGSNQITPKREPPDLHMYPDFDRNNVLDTIDELEDDSIIGLDHHQQLFGIRRQRKFILESDKDDLYWDRRKRNNEAAKRSREKRRVNDMILESRVMELTKENNILKGQLEAMYLREQRANSISYGSSFRFNNNENKFSNNTPEFLPREKFQYFHQFLCRWERAVRNSVLRIYS